MESLKGIWIYIFIKQNEKSSEILEPASAGEHIMSVGESVY